MSKVLRVAGGHIGDLLQKVLDDKGLSDRAFAHLLAKRYGGDPESHRSTVARTLKNTHEPRRLTRIKYAETLDLPPEFFLPEPDAQIVDAALLSRLVGLLEQHPAARSEEVALLLREVADQLAEMANRLRRASEQRDAR